MSSNFKRLLVKDFPKPELPKESIEQNYWNQFEVYIYIFKILSQDQICKICKNLDFFHAQLVTLSNFLTHPNKINNLHLRFLLSNLRS